ncbi:hypothetical protein [Comamonas composti]|uniref:hypothetical protein n=1 Tax=Comamonas composti TaxID=408558 RepID=UPI0004285AD1|nr:hypothetical protein [Comamonas composti]
MFMQIVVAMLVLIGITFSVVVGDREQPPAERSAQLELDQLRSFAFSVDQYLAAHADFEGSLSWSAESSQQSIQAAHTTPMALREVRFPENWRAVVKDMDYVLCAPISEAAAALLAADMPDKISGHSLREGTPSPQAPAATLVFASSEDTLPGPDNSSSPIHQWALACSI